MNIEEIQDKRIAVLLSGGVDSSVVVYEFAKLGLHPDCFYIKIGPEEDAEWDCSSEEDLEMATAVAHKYGCKLEVIDCHKEYWNQGYMTEALAEVIRYSFTQLPVHRLEAMHETTNPASGRVMEKCCMIQEGMMRGRVWNKTHFSDVMMYGITREQYEHP